MKSIFCALALIGYIQCAKLDHLKYLPPDSRPATSESFDQGLAAPDFKSEPQLVQSAKNIGKYSPSSSTSFGPAKASSQDFKSSSGSPQNFNGPQLIHGAQGSSKNLASSASLSSPSGPTQSSAFGPSSEYSNFNNNPSAGSSSASGPKQPSKSSVFGHSAQYSNFNNNPSAGSSSAFGPKQSSQSSAFGPSSTSGPKQSSQSSAFVPSSGYSNFNNNPSAGSSSASGPKQSSQSSAFGASTGYSNFNNNPSTSFSRASGLKQLSQSSAFGPSRGYSHSINAYSNPNQKYPGSNIASSNTQPIEYNNGKTGYYSQQQKYQPTAPQNQIPIIKLETTNNGDGSYSTAYETGNGIQAEEQGETKGDNSLVQGTYSYTSPEGDKVDVSYTADEDGYHPHGDNLPTPPPVPDAILKSIEYNKAHPEEENDSEEYSGNSRQYLSPKPSSYSAETPPSFHSNQQSFLFRQNPNNNQQPSANYGPHPSQQHSTENGPSVNSATSSNLQLRSSKNNPSDFSPGSGPNSQESYFNASPKISELQGPSSAQNPSAFSHGSSSGYNSAPQTSGSSSSQYFGQKSHSSDSPNRVSVQYSNQGPSSSGQNPSAFVHGLTNGYSATQKSDSSVSPISGQYSYQASTNKGSSSNNFPDNQPGPLGSGYQYKAPSKGFGPSYGPSASKTVQKIAGEFGPGFAGNHVNPSKVAGVQAQDANGAYIY